MHFVKQAEHLFTHKNYRHNSFLTTEADADARPHPDSPATHLDFLTAAGCNFISIIRLKNVKSNVNDEYIIKTFVLKSEFKHDVNWTPHFWHR